MAEIKRPPYEGDFIIFDERHTLKDILRFLHREWGPDELQYHVTTVIEEEKNA